ncbi:MAG: DNRLRE domain-containing protein [Planctomycetota bacterium]|jgi:hypothetical protein
MKKIVLLLTITLLCATWTSAGEVLYDENPYEDAYVSEGADGPGGDVDLLYIQGAGNVTRSLIKFDTSTIPTGAIITSAVLGIYLEEEYMDGFGPSVTMDAELFYVDNDNWDDATVDWDFVGGLTTDSSTYMGFEAMPDEDQYYEWDLLNTSGINISQIDLDDYLSLMLRSRYENIDNYGVFFSAESDSLQPYLKITYSVIPAPGSITLAVIGLSSVMAIRRKKRNL